MNHRSSTSVEADMKAAVTSSMISAGQRDAFLYAMDRAVAWDEIEGALRPGFLATGLSKTPHPLAAMIRIYFVQRSFGLSDAAMEQALGEVQSIRRFAGLQSPGGESMPDESSIQQFREFFEAQASPVGGSETLI